MRVALARVTLALAPPRARARTPPSARSSAPRRPRSRPDVDGGPARSPLAHPRVSRRGRSPRVALVRASASRAPRPLPPAPRARSPAGPALVALAAFFAAALARPAPALADGRHSRSKLREKEDRANARANAESAAASRTPPASIIRADDGAVTVDFKSAKKELGTLGDRVARAHKRAMKKLKKKVDRAVSGLNNGESRPATFRAARQTMQPGGYMGRSGYGYARPPPWIGGLFSWAILLGAAWAVIKVFGLGGSGGSGFRLPSFGSRSGSRRRPPPGAGSGRWVTDRSLGGREIWVEDARTRSPRGGALAESLEASGDLSGGGFSEAAQIAARREEARAREQKRRNADLVEPAWWSPPAPGYCPESQRVARATAARAALAKLNTKRVGGAAYDETDLADLRDACASARASVADRVKPESARTGIYKAGVEFALDAAKARSSTRAIGVPATFLTGLADDVGVAPGRAARLVDAAVAARTRGELLQAGAQVRAGEEGAAMLTLDGIIGILGTFPPERGSAEFEMVAAGLTSRLTEAERAKLLDAFRAIGGGEEQTRAVAEALGLDDEK